MTRALLTRRWRGVVVAVALTAGQLAAASIAPSAHAAFGPARVVSATDRSQANAGSGAPAVSADGAFVAFSTTATNLYPASPEASRWGRGGIFRSDLDTGALELVVPSDLDGIAGVPGTPSMSADGRYVVFSTVLPLVPQDVNQARDVYRRDMSLPITDPAAFTLVSAPTGSTEPLRYAGGVAGANAGAGAVSADGNAVIFLVEARSNVVDPAAPGTPSPIGMIAVRDIAAATTTVVNLTRTGAVPAFTPATPADVLLSGQRPRLTADGRHALWTVSSYRQFTGGPADNGNQALLERDLGQGPASTRLVMGASDPENPDCGAGGTISIAPKPGPCDGVTTGGGPATQPIAAFAADAHGDHVAVIALSRGTFLSGGNNNGGGDLYVVDMDQPGSRRLATARLTIAADGQTNVQGGAVDLSPDGDTVAFVASKWSPTINPPSPIGVFPVDPLGLPKLYLVDLARQTIEPGATSFDGAALDGGVSDVAVADGGRAVAFSTQATNVFFGDANGATDIVVRRAVQATVPAPLRELDAAIPPVLDPTPDPRLYAQITRTSDGGAKVTVSAPWAGRIAVAVQARPQVVRQGARARKPAQLLAPRELAVGAETSTVLTLRPRAAYRRRLRARSVAATATVTLTAPGLATLTRTLPVALHRTARSR